MAVFHLRLLAGVVTVVVQLYLMSMANGKLLASYQMEKVLSGALKASSQGLVD